MVEVRVRPAVPGDGPAIGRAHVEAWQTGYAGLMPSAFLHGLDAVERGGAWEQRLIAHQRSANANTNDDPEFLVAELDQYGVVAIATIGPERDDRPDRALSGEVWMINVAPGAWGRGVGSVLLQAAVDRLKQRGCSRPVLWVLESNTRARAFYEHNGWTFDGASKSEHLGGRELCELRYAYTPTSPTRDPLGTA